MPHTTSESFLRELGDERTYLADPNFPGIKDPLREIVESVESGDLVRDLFPEVPADTDYPDATLSTQFLTLGHMLLNWGNARETCRGKELNVELVFSGENSEAVAMVDGGDDDSIAVKMIPDGKETGSLEASVLLELERHELQPPVEIPRCRLYMPKATGMLEQLWLTVVGGKKLSTSEVRNFSDTEKYRSGKKLGEFVAHMASAIPLERYETIWKQAGSPELFDRATLMWSFKNLQRLESKHLNTQAPGFVDFKPKTDMYPSLVKALRWLEKRCQELEAQDRLQGSIVAHDDLRPGNFTFTKRDSSEKGDGEYDLMAIFDFELIRRLSPERALRFVVPLGTAAINGAKEGYGQPLSDDELHFWAVGQWVTMAAVYQLLPEGEDREAKLKNITPELQALLPDEDWSGLASSFSAKKYSISR